MTFERILREVKAKYVLGLTATPTRKDGHQSIIYIQCGPIRFHLSAKKAAESSTLQHKVFPRITDFGWNGPENETAIEDIYAALIVSQERNDLIFRDLQQALSSGRSPLALTSRTEHLGYLVGRLRGLCPHIFILRGGKQTGQVSRTAKTDRDASPKRPS